MKRILWMVLMNLWYVPYGIIRLFRMAAHPERYSLEERYALIRQIDNRAIKGRARRNTGRRDGPASQRRRLYPLSEPPGYV